MAVKVLVEEGEAMFGALVVIADNVEQDLEILVFLKKRYRYYSEAEQIEEETYIFFYVYPFFVGGRWRSSVAVCIKVLTVPQETKK